MRLGGESEGWVPGLGIGDCSGFFGREHSVESHLLESAQLRRCATGNDLNGMATNQRVFSDLLWQPQ